MVTPCGMQELDLHREVALLCAQQCGPAEIAGGLACVDHPAWRQRIELISLRARCAEVAVDIEDEVGGVAGIDADRIIVAACTITAAAFVRPSREFMVEMPGCASPAGHTVRYPSEPCGTTVTFSEYADAEDGMLQPPSCGMMKFCELPP